MSEIKIPASRDEIEQLDLAASLRDLSVLEYVRRALNAQMRREGVDAVLFRESDDEAQPSGAVTPSEPPHKACVVEVAKAIAALRKRSHVFGHECFDVEEVALAVAEVELQSAPLDPGGWRAIENRPRVMCLCGSSRFIAEMAVIAWTMEKEGVIVLSMHLLPANYPGVAPDHQAEAEGISAQMDELHKRKIDMADEVLIVNIGGYIGESTRSEIAYATAHGKPVRYIEPLPAAPPAFTPPEGAK